MNRRRGFIGFAAAILCVLLIGLFQAGDAYAAGSVDVSAPTSLTLTYEHVGVTIGKVPVRIYRVASVDESDVYTLNGDFSSYPVKLDTAFTSSEWDSAANTLKGYVTADGISPTAQGATASDGTVNFSGLTSGLYLVISDQVTESDGITYVTAPFLISLPNLDSNDRWVYDVTSQPKVTTSSPSSADIQYKVVKHWSDEGYESIRPTSITVGIYRDGALDSTQTLDGSNDWSYSWKATDDGSVWSVVEMDVPDDYTVTVTQEGVTFIATNTYVPPTTPTNPGGTTPPSSGSNVSLPKTGDTTPWWPIILAAGSGLILLVIGLRRRSSDR